MQVSTSNNHIYKFVLNADGENGLPSDVFLSTDNGRTKQNVFPYKEYITGIGSVTWKESGFFLNGTHDAIIYYTRGK